MSEILTIAPHQPANQGSPRDELVDKTFDREQQIAVAVRDRGAVVADRNDVVAGQTERRAPPRRCRSWRRCRCCAAAFPPARISRVRRSCGELRQERESLLRASRTADRNRGRPASCDAACRAVRLLPACASACGGTARHSGSGCCRETCGSRAHGRRRPPAGSARLPTAPSLRYCPVTASREPHQTPGSSGWRWIRTVPTTASAATPNSEIATIGIAVSSTASRSSPSNNPCSVAKHLAAQRRGAALLPGFGRELDLVGAGEKRLERFEHHARILFS